jgi:hypothetical protein
MKERFGMGNGKISDNNGQFGNNPMKEFPSQIQYILL